MFPYYQLPLLGSFHTGFSLMLVSILFCLWFADFSLRKELSFFKVLSLTVGVSILGFLGARLFHVFFERAQHFHENPGHIFTRFDGMTFYGAFIAGGIVVYLFNLVATPKLYRAKVWDTVALSCAFTYGMMRLGCFASGCCWGSITPVSWSVTYYNSQSVMPSLGIPVHPVQLYDAALGFGIFFLLLWLRSKKTLNQGSLLALFLVLYPLGRYMTEEYRGDAFRGENILWGLSMSQVISVGVFTLGMMILLKGKKRSTELKKTIPLGLRYE